MDNRQDIEEFLKTSRVNEKIDRERAELFGTLTRNVAFKAYLDLLNELIEARGAELMSPAGSMDGAMRLEHVKGSMYGMILARDLVPVTIASMKASARDEEEEAA